MRWRAGRRWWLGGAGAAALLAIALIGPPILDRLRTEGRLSLSAESYDFCWKPPRPADRTRQAAHGLAFGLDRLVLPSASARLTVTSVRMRDHTPGLELLDVAFIPIGGVGIGTPGERDWTVPQPGLSTMKRRVPATLQAVPEAARLLGLPQDQLQWTLAVKLRYSAGTGPARVDGFTVTYRTGSRWKTLRTRDTVTISPTGVGCTDDQSLTPDNDGNSTGMKFHMSDDKTVAAGEGLSDEEMARQVAAQTDSQHLQADVFEREADGASSETEAAKADADELGGG